MKNDQSPFQSPVPSSEGAMVPIEQHRAISETQAAVIVAKKFPRDEHQAYTKIMKACERSSLAKEAEYAYPRGGQMVTGPSIRLAEVIAQNWGNLNFGIRELSQDNGESELESFCWDLESNVKQSKIFKVPHKRKAQGGFKSLSDPRDVYEHVANMGARRLRACILGIIPRDITEAAQEKCDETLKKGDGKPLEDRIRTMLSKFEEQGVTKEMIEERLQHQTTAIVERQIVDLTKIFISIRDGMSKREDWFNVPKGTSQTEASKDLTEKIKGADKKEPTKLEGIKAQLSELKEKNFATWQMGKVNAKVGGEEPKTIKEGQTWLDEIEALEATQEEDS